jgi:heterodisulfide reductase subunit A
MARILVAGGGLAGCTAALELANYGHDVIIVEKTEAIGGKVRNYGCKATDVCNQCGLCLSGNLWESIGQCKRIKTLTRARVIDLSGIKGNYQATIKQSNQIATITDLAAIVAAIGFDEFSALSAGSLEFEATGNIITGYQLERLLKERRKENLLPQKPSCIGFIQCYGSRDCREQAGYCSRVCCGYSTRAARVLRKYYPEAEIIFFYMDLQQVEAEESYHHLLNERIEFVRSRPITIVPGNPPAVVYEKSGGGIIARRFDLVVLTEGIHPARDAAGIAELFGLGFTRDGFLKIVKEGRETGIYLTGCAAGPKRIEEVSAESIQTAREIHGGLI